MKLGIRKIISWILAGALTVLTPVPAYADHAPAGTGESAAAGVSRQETAAGRVIRQKIANARLSGRTRSTVLVASERGQAPRAASEIARAGGAVTGVLSEFNLVIADVPAERFADFEDLPAVRAISFDEDLALDGVELAPFDGPVPDQADPRASLDLLKAELRIPEFTSKTRADGSGVTVAILDTGIDPAALGTGPDEVPGSGRDASKRLIDWADLTGEGDVDTSSIWTKPIPGISSAGGVYRRGTLRESSLSGGPLGRDLDRNGRNGDTFDVLVVDSATPGLYDTVYVDSDRDGSFSDERPLKGYRERFDAGRFGSVNFVVTSIAEDGSRVNLGFDASGHGSRLAALIGAGGPAPGIAPGARLMAVKVLRGDGGGSLASIARGIAHAAAGGADLIALGLPPGVAGRSAAFDSFLEDLSASTKVVLSLPAGDGGPGIRTAAPGARTGSIVTSGAFVSPRGWETHYGLKGVSSEGLWSFSAAGPAPDGGLGPDLVAPGSAVVAGPGWTGPAQPIQGTGFAAASTAGSLALLISAARAKGLAYEPQALRRALTAGARPLDGYQAIEQGYGLIQVDRAWEALQSTSGKEVPALSTSVPDGPGVYSSRLDAVDAGGAAADLTATVVLPYELTSENRQTVTGLGRVVEAAKLKRFFFRVPAGVGAFDVSLAVPAPAGAHPAGRVRVLVTSPGGHLARVTPWLGARSSHDARMPESGISLSFPDPEPGVWEVDVYASPEGPDLGLTQSTFRLEAAARGITAALTEAPTGERRPLRVEGVFRNYLGSFAGVTAFSGPVAPQVERLNVSDQGFTDRLLDVPTGTLALKLSLRNPSDPGADLRLTLWYNKPGTGRWLPVPETTEGALAALLLRPKPGLYAVEIRGNRVPQGNADFELFTWLLPARFPADLSPPKPAPRAFGEEWRETWTIPDPAEPGDYLGALVLKDGASGRILSVLPVEIR